MDIGLKIGRSSLIATDNEFHGVYHIRLAAIGMSLHVPKYISAHEMDDSER